MIPMTIYYFLLSTIMLRTSRTPSSWSWPTATDRRHGGFSSWWLRITPPSDPCRPSYRPSRSAMSTLPSVSSSTLESMASISAMVADWPRVMLSRYSHSHRTSRSTKLGSPDTLVSYTLPVTHLIRARSWPGSIRFRLNCWLDATRAWTPKAGSRWWPGQLLKRPRNKEGLESFHSDGGLQTFMRS